MLIKHPTNDGWLIATDEIKRINDAGCMIPLPDGSIVHPLSFYQPDITDKNKAIIYLVTEILAALETAFWQFAKQFTGEPEITQLKLKNWQDKYYLAQHWELNGKPDVFKDPEIYAAVILEASKRFNLTDPNQLIESWSRNSTAWENLLNWYYQQYEPEQRGLVYKAQAEGNIDYLIDFSNKVEVSLYADVNKHLGV